MALSQAGRISRLKLHADPGGFCSFLCKCSLPGHTLSSLTKAGLFSDRLEPPEDDIWIFGDRPLPPSLGDRLEIPDGGIRIFGDHPLLRKLTIRLHKCQSELLKALRSLHILLSQLTELTLGVHSSPHSVLCILMETVNLVRCKIRFGGDSLKDDPAFDLVLPWHLENLKLFSFARKILIWVVQHITLPYLRQLQVYADSPLASEVSKTLPSAILALINSPATSPTSEWSVICSPSSNAHIAHLCPLTPVGQSCLPRRSNQSPIQSSPYHTSKN